MNLEELVRQVWVFLEEKLKLVRGGEGAEGIGGVDVL